MGQEWRGGPPGRAHRDDAVAWRNRAVILLDHLPMPVAVCDTEGAILLANPLMAAEWGTLPSQLRGRNALDFFRPRSSDQLHPVIEALRRRRRSRYPVEVRWSAPGGSERHGEMTVDVVSEAPDAETALLLLLNVLGDVTEPAERPDTALVSPVEARILALAAGGVTTAQIAKSVGLTADGVNYHLQRMSRRWRVPNRTALVARAYVLGVLKPAAWPPEPA
ncbi:helix-turn-helix transcriptional regulator [Saccharopolyspora shandongensis]|uniref:helix-turn-helix transcriptional regulator n=1 Tax=Saccharopolyspora shandongensis TaxID=418495 RepID=UPI0033CBA0AB